MIHLTDLLAATGGELMAQGAARTFEAFAFDSRLVQPGELFVAVKSERGDGHRFIAEAVAKGAAGVLCERAEGAQGVTTVRVENTQLALQAWGRYILRKYGTEVIGVTGSTGKTTTKELIAHLMTGLYPIFKNPGNWNGRYGLPLALGLLDPDQSHAVLEMASDARGGNRGFSRARAADGGGGDDGTADALRGVRQSGNDCAGEERAGTGAAAGWSGVPERGRYARGGDGGGDAGAGVAVRDGGRGGFAGNGD